MKIDLKSAHLFEKDALFEAMRNNSIYKSRTRFVWMKPDLFLSIARPIPRGHEKYKMEGIQDLMREGKQFSDIPLLLIQPDNKGGFECVGHEGRHRSLWIKENTDGGNVPVRLIDKETRWNEDGLINTDIMVQQEVGSSYFKVRV